MPIRVPKFNFSAGGFVRQEYCIEELPVTLQVGLVGADGWIIASDTREILDADGMELSSSTQKLYNNDAFALSFSGDEWSRRMRDEIIQELANASIDSQRAVVSKSRPEVWKQIPISARFRTTRRLLFGSANDLTHLYEISVAEQTSTNRKQDFVTAGHLGNPAQFFIQHYYIEKAGQRGGIKNTVDRLKLLAAHTIVQAARHNNRVDGLEMVVCRTNGNRAVCERVPESEITNLIIESDNIDQQLVKLFGVL
jgi:20S proteasome alpha/beta subunit